MIEKGYLVTRLMESNTAEDRKKPTDNLGSLMCPPIVDIGGLCCIYKFNSQYSLLTLYPLFS